MLHEYLKILVGKPEKIPFMRHGHRWEHNVNMDLSETIYENVNLSWLKIGFIGYFLWSWLEIFFDYSASLGTVESLCCLYRIMSLLKSPKYCKFWSKGVWNS